MHACINESTQTLLNRQLRWINKKEFQTKTEKKTGERKPKDKHEKNEVNALVVFGCSVLALCIKQFLTIRKKNERHAFYDI